MRDDGFFAGCAFWGAVFIGIPLLRPVVGGWAFLLPVVCLAVSIGYPILRDEIESSKRKTLPCQHGVVGAASLPEKCPKCLIERKKAAERIEAQRQEEKQRKDAERAKQYAEWVASIRLPEYLRRMDPAQFERLTCELFRRMGFVVQGTRYVGDNGIDGILERNGQQFILQCKRVKGSVGEPILRDLFGAMHASGAQGAFVVTTGKVSDQARKWAEGKPIEIVELDKLTELISQSFNENDVVPRDFVPNAGNMPLCPRCGSPLRTIKGKRGKFVGCTSYPECRYTRDAKRGQWL